MPSDSREWQVISVTLKKVVLSQSPQLQNLTQNVRHRQSNRALSLLSIVMQYINCFVINNSLSKPLRHLRSTVSEEMRFINFLLHLEFFFFNQSGTIEMKSAIFIRHLLNADALSTGIGE